MNQLSVYRNCTRVDHKNQIIKYICLEDGDNLSRWWCKYCYKEYKLHNLGSIKKLKILDQPKLKKLLQDQVNNQFNKNNNIFLQQQLKNIIQELEEQIKLLKQSLDELSQYVQKQQDYHNIIDFVGHDSFLGLEQKEIQQIKDFLYNIQQEKLRQNIISINTNLNQLSDRMKSVFSDPIESSFIKNSNFTIKELDTNNDFLNVNIGVQTSADLQYIALAQSQGALKLYHQQQIVKQVELQQVTTSIQFSQDNQYLYLGQQNGNLVTISLKDYSCQSDLNLHCGYIHSILILDQEQIITFSSDCFIKFNHKTQNIIRRIQSSSSVNCVELIKKYNLIALCDDNNLHIFSLLKEQFIIKQQCLTKIKQIQCQGKKIYSIDNTKLIIWNISLSKKQVHILSQIDYKQPILDIIISQSVTFYIIMFEQSLQIIYNGQSIREIYYSQSKNSLRCQFINQNTQLSVVLAQINCRKQYLYHTRIK